MRNTAGGSTMMAMMRSFLLLALLLLADQSLAATCTKTGSTCVDITPCKSISGVPVCLTNPAVNASCWQYADTYKCVKPNAIDYCDAFRQVPTCSQQASTCAVNDAQFNSGCMEWTNTWKCNTDMSTPANTVFLGNTYTITRDVIDNSQCQTHTNNPSCLLASHTCTDPAATRNINSLNVYKDCWAWQDTYSCLGVMQSNCADQIAKGCTLSATQCLTTAITGECSLTENVFKCPASPGTTTTVLDCGTQAYCMNGNCFNTEHVPDADLAQTAAMMEMMRQGANYQDGSMRIFGGTQSSCTKTLHGLFNCCKASGGGSGMKNSTVMGTAVQMGLSAGGQSVKYGSAYVYDSLFDSSTVVRGFDSMLSSTPVGSLAGGSSGGFSPSFGMYGFSATFGAAAQGATVLGQFGGMTIAFDPTSLMISVAIMVIQELMKCSEDERMLGMKKGVNLCRFTKSECTFKPPLGNCHQVTESYCCFNSILAKIINTSGGQQLGRSPLDCSGFTPEEFALLDFSKIDLTEFTSEIIANVKMPSSATVGSDNAATIQLKLNNYYTSGKQ